MSDKDNIIAKLVRVCAKVEKLEPQGKVKISAGREFPFLTATQVFDAVRPALAEERVLIYFSKIEKTRTTENNGRNRIEALVTVVFTSADDPSATLETVQMVEVFDLTDKGFAILRTAAVKQALLTFLVRATGGDDPDEIYVEEPKPKPKRTSKPATRKTRTQEEIAQQVYGISIKDLKHEFSLEDDVTNAQIMEAILAAQEKMGTAVARCAKVKCVGTGQNVSYKYDLGFAPGYSKTPHNLDLDADEVKSYDSPVYVKIAWNEQEDKYYVTDIEDQ